MYEVPNFISKCALLSTTPVVVDLLSQYMRDVLVKEFTFTEYTAINQVTGKLRLIEYGPNLAVKGVSFLANG